jgi:hypothetical protein
VADGRFVPVVGRAGEALDDGRFIPLDAACRVLMLMRQSDGMAEFVGSRAAIHEPQIHGRLIQWNAAVVRADVRPGAVVGVEGDTNLGVRRAIEIEMQVGKGGPPQGLFLRLGLLCGGTPKEADPQGAAIHPQFADWHNGTGASATAHRGLKAHLVTRQQAVCTKPFIFFHDALRVNDAR